MSFNHYPIAILGAGPAGATVSMGLTSKKINHILIDKATFPRDKICGDALSGKVVYALNRVKPDVVKQIAETSKTFLPSWGISFIAPNGKRLNIPFTTNKEKIQYPPGFISTRFDFDNLLVENTKSNHCTPLFDTEVEKIEITDNCTINLKNGQSITADLIVDCSGAHSPIARNFGFELEHKHHCAGLRQYYENVAGLSEEGYIELHFIKNVLPGYFWIFPMTNNRANVGIGMLTDAVSKNKINLKSELKNIIENHPEISKRFKNAKPLESVKGWGLPLGSKKRELAHNRILFCGDAASLIDPFTGEGIGNAMISAKYATDVAAKAIVRNDFSIENLNEYTQLVYKHLGPELNISHQLQKMVKYPWLFNFVANKGHKSAAFRELLTSMFENVDLRKKFKDPKFYFNLLFNK
ncbi:MAG: geranylgeranyl reductase family protein [Flavobacteriales bacterium]|nr:geranylgeranyl reductase family protein [Flavobacteriales bacterium]